MGILTDIIYDIFTLGEKLDLELTTARLRQEDDPGGGKWEHGGAWYRQPRNAGLGSSAATDCP
jgi:hypothetical protein